MIPKIIQILIVLLSVTASSSMLIEKDDFTVKKKDKFKALDIPKNCKKNTLLNTKVATGKSLSANDLGILKSQCAQYYPDCKHQVGTLRVTYAEDPAGKSVIIFDAMDIEKQGCWGHMLEIKNDVEVKNIYFNFDQEDKDFRKFIYFRLGFTYNFTVTSLPSGQSFSIATQAPTGCELEVMKNIYYRLEKEERLFKNCDLPGYAARKSVASKICAKYPRNGAKRWKFTHKRLTEENCKFIIVSNNFINNAKSR